MRLPIIQELSTQALTGFWEKDIAFACIRMLPRRVAPMVPRILVGTQLRKEDVVRRLVLRMVLEDGSLEVLYRVRLLVEVGYFCEGF
jgi:hypothetical protein